MGMYDTILVYLECPFCGKEYVADCQTKSLNNNLVVYNMGDFVGNTLDCELTKPDSILHVIAITDCSSKECKGDQSFGKFFNVKIEIINGIISSFEILEKGYQKRKKRNDFIDGIIGKEV